jgi:hypothetical protein
MFSFSILQKEFLPCPVHPVYKQTKSVNNQKTVKNRNDSDLVQAFLKKWWAESDFKALNLSLSLRLKGCGCHYNSIYNKSKGHYGLHSFPVVD